VGLSLSASLFVAFSFIPALGARLLRAGDGGDRNARAARGARLTPLPAAIDADGASGGASGGTAPDETAGPSKAPRRPLYVRFYAALLGATLRFPWATVILCAALVGGSWHLF